MPNEWLGRRLATRKADLTPAPTRVAFAKADIIVGTSRVTARRRVEKSTPTAPTSACKCASASRARRGDERDQPAADFLAPTCPRWRLATFAAAHLLPCGRVRPNRLAQFCITGTSRARWATRVAVGYSGLVPPQLLASSLPPPQRGPLVHGF